MTIRDYAGAALRVWPTASVIGEGPHVVLSYCQRLRGTGPMRVSLHPTGDDATDYYAEIRDHGCGPECRGAHDMTTLPGATDARPRRDEPPGPIDPPTDGPRVYDGTGDIVSEILDQAGNTRFTIYRNWRP